MTFGPSCGARISYLVDYDGYELTNACRLVAGEQFPRKCGPCNPETCQPADYEQDSSNGMTSEPSPSAPLSTPEEPARSTPFTREVRRPSPVAQSRAPTPTGTGADDPEEPLHCGCLECTEEIWNADANGYTCGNRIEYLLMDSESYPTEESACRQVGLFEFSTICGPGCNPDRCDGRQTPLTPQSSIYCFPEYEDRTRFENVWGNYIVEVKEGASW